MKHIFKKGNSDKTLLLLHGTGGTEEDLLPLASLIDKNANILAVRGNVLEGRLTRFFKRLSEGVFDLEDLKFRTNELNEFIDNASIEYNFDRSQVVAVGYSNGANIAVNLVLNIENSLSGAILYHPMLGTKDNLSFNLNNLPVFIGAGKNDPICPPNGTNDLDFSLRSRNSNVGLYWYNKGHSLTQEEVMDSTNFYNKHIKKEI